MQIFISKAHNSVRLNHKDVLAHSSVSSLLNLKSAEKIKLVLLYLGHRVEHQSTWFVAMNNLLSNLFVYIGLNFSLLCMPCTFCLVR